MESYLVELDFANKVVVVTGSGTGIGQAIAKKFAEKGASIILLGRRKEPLEETQSELHYWNRLTHVLHQACFFYFYTDK